MVLEEAFVALAASGSTALVQAAGTDAWEGIRNRMAKLFGRHDQQRERAELERLNYTAAILQQAPVGEIEELRIRQEASWQTRIEDLLESLDADEREQVSVELRSIIDDGAVPARTISAEQGALAAGGNIDIRADRGSIAGGAIHGDVTIGSPPKPDPTWG
jgi:hypothetical protein